MAFTQASARILRDKITRQSAILLRRKVKPLIDSRTLRKSVAILKYPRGHKLSIPYYWAVYEHDGRGAITMPAGQFLVFFTDPKDDPRLQGGYPQRESQQQHLSKGEFQFFLAENFRRRKAGQPPIMIVKRRVAKVSGTKFFTRGLRGSGTDPKFGPSAVAPRLFSEYVLRELERAGLLHVRDEAFARLR